MVSSEPKNRERNETFCNKPNVFAPFYNGMVFKSCPAIQPTELPKSLMLNSINIGLFFRPMKRFEFFFRFVFHAKSGTTNNHRTGWSDISYSNHILKFSKKITSVEKNRFETLIFRPNSSKQSNQAGLQQLD